MRKIPVKVYVNFCSGEVITREEYSERMQEGTLEYFENLSTFREFLEENYTHYDLFTMTDEGKADLKDKFEDYCRETWENNDAGEWEENTLYVSIPREEYLHH